MGFIPAAIAGVSALGGLLGGGGDSKGTSGVSALGGLLGGGGNSKGTSGVYNNFDAKGIPLPTNMYTPEGVALNQSDYQQSIAQGLGRANDTSAINAQGGKQGSLADALLAQSQGGGPANDLVQSQLTQGQNQAQNQAAGLAASVRGINPALAARLALQNQAAMGQQAAGQAAQLKGQIALNSQGQLSDALYRQRQQDLATQQQGAQLAGLAGGLQNQQNQTAVQQNLGVDTLKNQQNQTAAQQNLGLQGLEAGVANQNATVAGNEASNKAGAISGLAGTIGGLFAKGGTVPGEAFGGYLREKSKTPKFVESEVVKEEVPIQAIPMKHGGVIPGKAVIAGDDIRNDKVPIMASPGEIVIPRSIAKDPEKAKQFVAKENGKPAPSHTERAKLFANALHKAMGGMIPDMKENYSDDDSKLEGYAKVIKKHKDLDDRLKKLEQLAKKYTKVGK